MSTLHETTPYLPYSMVLELYHHIKTLPPHIILHELLPQLHADDPHTA